MKKGLLILLGMLFCVGVAGSINKIGDYKDAERYYNQIEEKYVSTRIDSNSKKIQLDEHVPQMKTVDFYELKKNNSDFVAWISFPEEVGIDYPIVQGSDDFYLYHSFNKEKNANGCLMIDATNRSDFSDEHTIIWGHNMKSRKMFGNLREYMDSDYATRNAYFWIYTEDRSLLYKIYSVHKVSLDSPAFWVDIRDPERRRQFWHALKDGNIIKDSEMNGKYDNIVTLATCTNNSNYRLLVHAELMLILD